jgi:putative ABC transport system permease protein
VWRATIKGLLGHKLRMSLTAIAIVLGVAFVTGTYVLTDTLTAFFDGVFKEANSGTDVVVRPNATFSGPGPSRTLPASVLQTVAAVPGVAAADGLVAGYAQLTDKNGKAIGGQGPPTLGFSWARNSRLSPLRLKTGRAPAGPDDVVIDAVTARKYHYAVGDPIKILFVGPARTLHVSGITGFGKSDNLGGATIAAFDLTTAQSVLGSPGQVSAIGVAARRGVSTKELLTRIRPLLPAGVEAVSGKTDSAESAKQINQAIGFLGTAILVFAGIALFVGSFIVANTFAIVINQRTRELGLLRAIGATGRQVMVSVLAEAAVVGTIASIIGLALGLVLGAGLRALVQTIGGGATLPGANIRLQPRTIVVSLLVGVLVTLVSAIVPARRGSRLSPVAAMRDVPEEAPTHVRRSAVAAAIAVAGIAMFGTGLFAHGIPLRWLVIAAGALLTFVGLARLSPLAARPVARVLGAPLSRVAGLAGVLARENAGRNPRRTASTAAALMIGLGLVGAVAIMAASLRASLDKAIRSTLQADYVVGSGMQEIGFTADVATRIRALPAVRSAVGVRRETWRLHGKTMALTSVDAAGVDDVLDLGLLSGSTAGLASQGVLVHRDEAARRHLALGDRIPMVFPATGVVSVPVAGIYRNSQVIGGGYILSLSVFRAGYRDDRVSTVFVKARPGTSDAAFKQSFASVQSVFPNLRLQDQAGFRRAQQDNVRTIVTIINALLALAIVIALLGIANTLALSIFERTRELGLLRAVGMSRRQVRRMIRWESVLIAVFGALLGVGIGLAFGVAVVKSLASNGLTDLRVPAGQLALLVVLAGLAGTVSAAFPARRAARLDILGAIAFE